MLFIKDLLEGERLCGGRRLLLSSLSPLAVGERGLTIAITPVDIWYLLQLYCYSIMLSRVTTVRLLISGALLLQSESLASKRLVTGSAKPAIVAQRLKLHVI